MNAQPHKVNNPKSELYRLLDEADRQPVDLEKNGVRYRVTRVADEAREAKKPYDPERMITAIYASAGILKRAGVDADQLEKDLYEERTQNSTGRPAE
ncbi:MAG: hypothetical protein ACYDAR_08110 [Thermomicrobiales bacterium]